MKDNLYDITIIGAGPVGMFAGFYAGMRELKVQLIDSLGELGGQVNAIYPEKAILDVAGFAGITGRELVVRLKEQLAQMPIETKLGTAVTNVAKDGDEFVITTATEVTRSKTVIVATGGGAFESRKLALSNPADLSADQVSYTIKDLAEFKDQTVIVAGGGNSAVDNALLLEKVAKQVYLVHRRTEFRGLEHMLSVLEASSVKVITPYLIKQVQPQDGHLIVTAKEVGGDDNIEIAADRVLVNYGFASSNKVTRGWSIDLAEEHHAFPVSTNLATNVDGIYAVGDCATYPGKDTLIATGFGEVPLAVNHIAKMLYPDRRQPVHSTGISR